MRELEYHYFTVTNNLKNIGRETATHYVFLNGNKQLAYDVYSFGAEGGRGHKKN